MKKKLWILVSVVLALALVGGAVLFVLFRRSDEESSFEKTMAALFPELAPLSSMAEAGEVDLTLSLGSDMIEYLQSPIDISLRLGYNQSATRLGMEFGSGTDRLDLEALLDQQGLSFSSSMLPSQEGYGFRFENLKEALDASQFAPTSGSEYALSKELYEQLLALSEQAGESEMNPDYLIERVSEILDSVKGKAEIKKEKRELALLDETAKATVTEISFDKAFFNALAEEMIRACGEDERLSLALSGLLLSDLSYPSESERQAALEKEIKSLLGSERETIEGKLILGERNGYLVYASLSCSATAEKASEGFALTFTSTSAPDLDSRFDFEMRFEENEKPFLTTSLDFARARKGEDVVYSLTALSESCFSEDSFFGERVEHKLTLGADGTLDYESVDSYAYDYQKLSEAEFEEDTEWEAHGTWESGEDSFSLTVNRASMISSDVRLFDIKKSSISLTLSAKAPTLSKTASAVDLCALEDSGVQALRAALQESLLERTEKINQALGATLFEYRYGAQYLGEATGGDAPYAAYAYDETTRRLFIEEAVRKNGTVTDFQIVAYDVDSMSRIGEIPLERDCDFLAADKGRLVVWSSQAVTLYDGSTLSSVKTLSHPSLYSDCQFLFLDGDKLIVVSGGAFQIYDIKTDVLKDFSGHHTERIFSAAIDRESHTLCLTGEKWHNQKADNVHLHNSQTGEEILFRTEDRSGHSYKTYFNGKAFCAYGYFRLPDGSTVTATSMVPGRRNSGYVLDAILYTGSDCYITWETSSDGMDSNLFIYPAATAEDGKRTPISDMLSYNVWNVIPLSENEFLICDSYNYQNSIVKIRIGPSWTFGGVTVE